MDNTANTKRDRFPLLAVIALSVVVGALIGGYVAKNQADGWEKVANRWEKQNKKLSAMYEACANPAAKAN